MDDQLWLERKLRSGYADLGTKKRTFSKTIHVGTGEYNQPNIIGHGPFDHLTYTGTGDAIVFHNGKDFVHDGLRVKGGNVVYETDGSSSRFKVANCRVDGGSMVFRALGGADMSAYTIQDSEVWNAEKCFVFEGANNLGPTLIACGGGCERTDTSQVAFDFSKGGSGAVMIKCRGSFAKTFVLIPGGFQLHTFGNESEYCGTIYKIGGDGLDGFGQEGFIEINDSGHRECSKFMELNKAGITKASVGDSRWPNLIELTNKSGNEGQLITVGTSVKVLEGAWKINNSIHDD